MEATLNAPQSVAPAKRARVTTPRSMQLPQNSAAISTPATIDYPAVVARVAKAKAQIGSKFMGHKGKQNLFALVCDAVRSMLNRPKFDEAGQPIHLPEEIAAQVKGAINEFWLAQARKVVEYGEVVSVQYDAPKAKVLDLEGGRKDVDLSWNATLKSRRVSKDDAEFRLGLSFEIGKATKRLAYMQDNPAKYDREEVRAAQNFLTVLEGKQIEMNRAAEAAREAAPAQ